MATKTFTDNIEENFGLDARNTTGGYRVLSYSGDLGGGTLTVKTKADEAADAVPVPDGTLSAADLDDNGNAVQQLVFISAGTVYVELSGATDPDAKVSVA